MARQRAAVDIDRAAGDAVLATQATAGSLAAFEELYRRHAQAAWRVAQAVTRNPDDAADAVSEAFAKVLKAVATGRLTEAERFRSYLLTASRNAALDVARRTGRVRPTDEAAAFDGPVGGTPVSDAVVAGFDQRMVASAFDSLPERWRSVLWLTEVEGIPAREAAGLLGVSANGVAQLAVRARAGLRERFLQAHLRSDVDAGCRYTVEHLGAYVAGGLSPRDIAKVDQHLAACDECRARKEDLEELGSSLRRIVLPFPLGLAALTVGKWKAAAAVGAGAVGSGVKEAPAWLLKAQRPLAVASVAMFAAGIVGVGVVGQSGLTPRDGRSRSDVPRQTLAAPTVNFTPAAAVSSGGGFGSDAAAGGGAAGSDAGGGTGAGNGFGDDASALESPRSSNDLPVDDESEQFRLDTPTTTLPGPTTTTTRPGSTSDPGPTPPTTQRPAVQTGVHVGSVSAGLGSGTGSQTGVANDGTTVVGTPPPAPEEHNTVTVDAGGTQLDPVFGNEGRQLAI